MKFEAVSDDGPGAARGGLDAVQFYVLRELSRDGTLSQRDLAARTRLSLGRANRVVNDLVRMGLLRVHRFKNARRRIAHRYLLTPEGSRLRSSLTQVLLSARLREYEALGREIEQLEREAEQGSALEARVP